jgi:hypothetical protein
MKKLFVGVFAVALVLGLGASTAAQATEIEARPLAIAEDGTVALRDFSPRCAASGRAVCISADYQYRLPSYRMTGPRSDLVPYGWDNRASSVCNASGGTVVLRQHQHYAGFGLILRNGRCYPDLRQWDLGYGDSRSWDNVVSSIEWW